MMRINLLKKQQRRSRFKISPLDRQFLWACFYTIALILVTVLVMVEHYATPLKDVPLGVAVFLAVVLLIPSGRR